MRAATMIGTMNAAWSKQLPAAFAHGAGPSDAGCAKSEQSAAFAVVEARLLAIDNL